MDSIIKSWLESDYELIPFGSVNWHAKSGEKDVKIHFQANGTYQVQLEYFFAVKIYVEFYSFLCILEIVGAI